MKTFAVHLAATLLIVAAAIFAYDRAVRLPGATIGVIDVAETYRDKEAQFVASIAKSGNPDDPNLAMRFAAQFATDLKSALETLPAECNCLVLIKAAVAAPSASIVDLTPALRAKVGLPAKGEQ